MVNTLLAGTGLNMPSVNIMGFFSNTWIWVAIVVVIGILLILTIGIILFFKTFNRKIIIFKQGADGLVPYKKTRARLIRLKKDGLQVCKLLMGGDYISAYGRSMGKNSYWYELGQDGYLRNFVLDVYGNVEYIDKDVRMLYGAIETYSRQTHGKSNTFEKVMAIMVIFVLLVSIIVGGWMIIGKIAQVSQAQTANIEASTKLQEANTVLAERLDRLLKSVELKSVGGSTGVIPAQE